jgi:hypothetical protein
MDHCDPQQPPLKCVSPRLFIWAIINAARRNHDNDVQSLREEIRRAPTHPVSSALVFISYVRQMKTWGCTDSDTLALTSKAARSSVALIQDSLRAGSVDRAPADYIVRRTASLPKRFWTPEPEDIYIDGDDIDDAN